MSESSTHRAFWDERYLAQTTPWDLGGAPAALGRFLATRPGRGASVLIPGCGSGHEVAAFARAGYNVTAIDFSPPAVARARANAGAQLAGRIVEGDFFTHPFAEAPFDLCHCWSGLPSGMVGWWLRDRQPYLVSLRGSDVPGYNRRLRLLDPLVLRHVARRVWRDSAGVFAVRSRNRASISEVGASAVERSLVALLPLIQDLRQPRRHFSPL